MLASINDVPNELIVMVFDNLIMIEDLIRCSKVCLRWKSLADQRLMKVKYISKLSIKQDTQDWPVNRDKEIAYYWMDQGLRNIPLRNRRLLPNLRVLEVRTFGSYPDNDIDLKTPIKRKLFMISLSRQSTIQSFLKQKQATINGLIYQPLVSGLLNCNLNHIEMLSVSNLGDWRSFSRLQADNLKQLSVFIYYQGKHQRNPIANCISLFPKLQRLHIDDPKGHSRHRFLSKTIINRNLTILEVERCWEDYPFSSLIYQFPNLKSLHLFFHIRHNWEIGEDMIKPHYSLRDLVIEFQIHLSETDLPTECDSLIYFLTYFPNLRNLAIRNHPQLKRSHVRKILRFFPSLERLDVRGCPGVTGDLGTLLSASKSAFSSVQQHKVILKDYLCGELTDFNSRNHTKPILKGFDFIKNCFYRTFQELPSFLVHDES